MRAAFGTWTLQVSDKTGNAGHLAKGTTGCSAAESRTDNALAVSASGTAVDGADDNLELDPGTRDRHAARHGIVLAFGLTVPSGKPSGGRNWSRFPRPFASTRRPPGRAPRSRGAAEGRALLAREERFRVGEERRGRLERGRLLELPPPVAGCEWHAAHAGSALAALPPR